MILIISAVILNFTRAKYRVTQSILLVNGTINYTPYDFKMVAMYQKEDGGEYTSIDKVPSSGYILNEEESYCEINGEKDNNIQIEYNNGSINFLGMTTKGTKCYLYFDEKLSASEFIIANKTISNERSGTISSTLTDDTTGTVYSVADDWGTSYAYAGAPTDNYVKFAEYWWRIIRINGDGSIRIIYDGTTSHANGESSSDRQRGTSAYCSSYSDNAYVGYMYGTPGSSTYEETHSNNNDSTIKEILDNWYQTNILDKNYDKYVSKEAGFCNDRKVVSGYSGYGTLGYGTNETVYAPTSRFYNTSWDWLTTQQPTLKCSQSKDLFTTSGSSKGNHALGYPIGLITADEVVVSGGFGGKSNESNYLYTGQDYWTMSPIYYAGGVGVFVVGSDGQFVNYIADWTGPGVRPVINLDSSVTLTGNGTSTNPFVVS